MPEPPDFDRIVTRLIGIFVASVVGSREDLNRLDFDAARKEALDELRQVWNARGLADRGRIGEVIGEQREPDYSLRMAQESIKTLDR